MEDDGTIVPESELTLSASDTGNGLYGWFDFELECECPPTEPCEDVNPNITIGVPDICIWPETQDGTLEECNSILGANSAELGTVCTKIILEDGLPSLELTFEASDDWAFVANEIWVDENLTGLPLDDGDLDTEQFPYYWCNSTGLTSWTTTIGLKWMYLCDGANTFSLSFVVQATLGQLLEDGSVDPSTEVAAFAYEYEADDIPGLGGWYDVEVQCVCPGEENGTTFEIDGSFDFDLTFTSGPVFTPLTECDSQTVLVDEDFEAREEEDSLTEGSEYSFSGATTSSSTILTHFLGRLGQGEEQISRDFVIPAANGVAADRVTMEFHVYQIDAWAASDTFTVEIGDTNLVFGDLSDKSEGGVTGGISWSRSKIADGQDFGFLSDNDAVHFVILEIPASKFSTGTLPFAFDVATSNSIDNASAGLDNFRLTARYGCGGDERRLDDVGGEHHFGMENFNSVADRTKASQGGDELDGPHCEAVDFPCDGGKKTYICHYSVFKGYNTYCVEEEDSDVIRFYPNDYCGPCVGGYGGKRPEADAAH